VNWLEISSLVDFCDDDDDDDDDGLFYICVNREFLEQLNTY
jgi:hypothetical protein